MKNNIILIGFMGSGKTSIGIKLTALLQKTLMDTDKYIETKQNMTVSEIFAMEGEAYFRKLETKCLEELLETADNQIISTGGGLPVTEENRSLLRQLGMVIYLRITADAVYERLQNDTARPLLQGKDSLGKIKQLLEARVSIYETCAEVVIDVSDKTINEILDEIAAVV